MGPGSDAQRHEGQNRMSSKRLPGTALFTPAPLETETYGALVLTHFKDDRGSRDLGGHDCSITVQEA